MMDVQEPDDYDFLPAWERELFHLLNAPEMQDGYYNRAIGQEFMR